MSFLSYENITYRRVCRWRGAVSPDAAATTGGEGDGAVLHLLPQL